MVNGPGSMQYAVAAKQTQVGGDWFFWIAGFSLINSLLGILGTGIHFVIGLGLTELFDGIGSHSGAAGKGAAFGLDLLAAGFYVLLGFFARKGARWAFLVGMIFYALDGVLLVFVKDWLSVAFHAYALYRMFQGFQAAGQLSFLRAQQASAAMPGVAPGVWPPPPSV